MEVVRMLRSNERQQAIDYLRTSFKSHAEATLLVETLEGELEMKSLVALSSNSDPLKWEVAELLKA